MRKPLIAAGLSVLIASTAYAAIDSAAKRSSAAGEHPIPDGTIDAGDRAQATDEYRGLIDGGGGGGGLSGTTVGRGHVLLILKRKRR